MSGVTPESTTAGLAGEVPKENGPTTNGPGAYTISSAAPDSTTAQLAGNVPLEGNKSSSDQGYGVNPIPATEGVGNPIHLKPGEPVPDPSTITKNTVGSTATTDKAGYERDASDPGMAAQAAAQKKQGEDNVHILPILGDAPKNPTIQSAGPGSTTAGLAGAVPLENTKSTSAVPDTVPGVVKESIEKAHTEPEAAASREAVKEKKEVEQQLLQEVPTKNDVGTPAPTATAQTSETAPAPTRLASGEISPKTKPTDQQQPAVTTGPETTAAPKTSGPAEPATKTTPATETAAAPADADAKARKRRSRVSGFFSKLKEKMK